MSKTVTDFGENVIGMSQIRGQKQMFYRGLVQRCPIPVKNLITFGSPHQVDHSPNDHIKFYVLIFFLAGGFWDPRLHSSHRFLWVSSIIIFTVFSTIQPRFNLKRPIFTVQAALSFASW